MFTGGLIKYKTNYQNTMAWSTIEAEFYALCETGKLSLFYLRSVLYNLGIGQQQDRPIYKYNQGCLLIVNSGKCLLLDWIDRVILNDHQIKCSDNPADALTKALDYILFHCHNEFVMGKLPLMHYYTE